MFYNLLLFVLSTAGCTWIITQSKLFEDFRNLHKKSWYWTTLFNCSACTGFHIGYIFFIIFRISGIILFPNILLGLLIFGCIGSLVSYAFDRVINDDGINIVINKGEE